MEAQTTPVGGGAGPPDSVSSAPAGEAGASHAVEIDAEQVSEPARLSEDQVTELPEPTRSQTEIIRLVLEAMEVVCQSYLHATAGARALQLSLNEEDFTPLEPLYGYYDDPKLAVFSEALEPEGGVLGSGSAFQGVIGIS